MKYCRRAINLHRLHPSLSQVFRCSFSNYHFFSFLRRHPMMILSQSSFSFLRTKQCILCMVLSFFSFVIAQIWPCEFWIDIEPDVREALEILGYNQEIYDSELDPYVTTSCLAWEDLTPNEQDAAVYIGFDEGSWDACIAQCPFNWWDDLYFNDLPTSFQAAALDLGYTEETWDNGVLLEYECLTWAELSDIQRSALEVLGYTETSSDAELDDEEIVEFCDGSAKQSESCFGRGGLLSVVACRFRETALSCGRGKKEDDEEVVEVLRGEMKKLYQNHVSADIY